MRIDLNGNVSGSFDTGQPTAASTKQVQAPAISQSDSTRLLTGQSTVQTLVNQVAKQPEIRQEKVAALARAIHDGQYSVTPEQTADAIFSELEIGRAA